MYIPWHTAYHPPLAINIIGMNCQMRGQCVRSQLWMEGGEDKGNNVTHLSKRLKRKASPVAPRYL